MRRWVAALVVLAALQGALWLFWRGRGVEDAPFPVAPASGPAPAVAPRDGVLHVWATWCVPCRDELPTLLREARTAGVPLVALSVDENPASVELFFAGAVPPEVVRATAPEGVRELPVTFRVRDGALMERVEGARAWATPSARTWLSTASD